MASRIEETEKNYYILNTKGENDLLLLTVSLDVHYVLE